MPQLQASLFERLRVASSDGAEITIENLKTRKLFAYLLLYRHRAHPRDALAALLWGEMETQSARKYLRQALWQINSATALPADDRPLLLADGDWIQVDEERGLVVDVTCFEATYATVTGTRGRELSPPVVRAIEQVLTLYRGELLQNWGDDWCLFERERFQQLYLAMVNKLVDYCRHQGEFERGIQYAQRILRYDRAHEQTHRNLIRLYAASGNRTAALRQYQICVETLRAELDVAPSARTRRLHALIRAGRLSERAAPAVDPRTLAATGDHTTIAPAGQRPLPASLPALLSRLRQYERLLQQLQANVSADIQQIEHALEKSAAGNLEALS